MINENLNESNEKERLTIEEYRNIDGFEKITNKEYEYISAFMFEFAQMLYKNEFN
jgi:formylmethanofuran dehydrogenase subunit B